MPFGKQELLPYFASAILPCYKVCSCNFLSKGIVIRVVFIASDHLDLSTETTGRIWPFSVPDAVEPATCSGQRASLIKVASMLNYWAGLAALFSQLSQVETVFFNYPGLFIVMALVVTIVLHDFVTLFQ